MASLLPKEGHLATIFDDNPQVFTNQGFIGRNVKTVASELRHNGSQGEAPGLPRQLNQVA